LTGSPNINVGVNLASRAAATFGTPLARWVGARFVLPATMR